MNSQFQPNGGRRPGRDAVNALLMQSEQCLQNGRHHAAIAVLGRVSAIRGADQDAELWSAWALASTARNRFHLGDNAGAFQCLGGIREDFRRANPPLDSECFSISGLLKRRQAHDLWKNGDSERARLKVAEAIEEFSLAALTSDYKDKRTQLNAHLNATYCAGLDSAIRSHSIEDNPKLLVRAIVLEQQIRVSSAPAVRDDISGLLIVADLSLGANLKVSDVFQLDVAESEAFARLEVLKKDNSSWSALLLETATATAVRPEIAAKGLVLGARALLLQEGSDVQKSLLKSYAVHIQGTLLDLQPEVQRETVATRTLRFWLRACVEAGGFQFTGRRMFR